MILAAHTGITRWEAAVMQDGESPAFGRLPNTSFESDHTLPSGAQGEASLTAATSRRTSTAGADGVASASQRGGEFLVPEICE